MSANNNAPIPTPRFATAPWYSLPGLRNETDIESIRRVKWTLWSIADSSARGPVILRIMNWDYLHGAARVMITMFIDSPDEFWQIMLMFADDDDRRQSERALEVMRRKNVAVWFDDATHPRWLELNVPDER